jgi:hypothetical protein
LLRLIIASYPVAAGGGRSRSRLRAPPAVVVVDPRGHAHALPPCACAMRMTLVCRTYDRASSFDAIPVDIHQHPCNTGTTLQANPTG